MKQKLSGILTLLLALVVQISFAQESRQVTGTVTDGDGLPLPGVNILVKGTQRGTQSDFDGNYSLLASPSDILVFSYLGFETIERPVGTATRIDATLTPDASELEEVVVMGYVTRGKNEMTGSSVQVSGEQIAEVPMVSADQALQGRVAGLQISTSSGTPGSVQDVRIRGLSSLSASNEPLYVIDGVPVINSNIAGSTASSSLSPLASINAQDIESMTVLKDASATAAYGARGSNGVIVITTKKGKSGEVRFDFNSSIGIQNDAYNERRVLTGPERLELTIESLVNAYGASNGFTPENALQLGVNFRLFPSAILDYDGEIYDWDNLIKNEDALLQNYTFSASGGTDVSSFYASVGYNNTEATVIGAGFERVNGSVNIQRQFRDNLDFSTSFNASHSTQNPILEQSSYFSNPFISRYLMNPLNNPFNEDGTPTTDLTFGSLHNTLYVTENNVTRNALTRLISNSSLDWEFVDNLTFRNTFSMDYQLNDYKDYRNRYEGDAAPVNGSTDASTEQNFNFVYQGGLNYTFNLGDHNLDVTGLFEYQKNQNSYVYAYGENFPTDGLTNIASASANFDAFSSYSDWYNVSYLALLNYNYARKYVLDATFRREGSSRFAEGNRFGNFGSVGAAWNLHMEDFLVDSAFSSLRLRASYGITGNSGIGLNEYQALLSYSADYSNNGGAIPSQFGNPDLTWEKGEAYDVGMSFGLFENRLSGSFSYYHRRTYDLLQSVPLSLTTGFNFQSRNVGEMINKGIEAELSFMVVDTGDFSWNVAANYATVDNEVTELALGSDGNPINPNSASSYKTTEVGLPAGAWFMRTWAGVDPQTGEPTWYLNGVDGEVTSNYNAAERVYQGASALPEYSGGFSTRVQYKGFFADANIYFAGGHKIYEQYAQFYMSVNSFSLGSYNGVEELLERWQQPGDITDVPALNYANGRSFQATSSRHLFDGDYVRLRNVAVGYSLPTRVAETIGLDGLTISLRGTNVATWLKDDGLKLDPEVQAIGYTTLTTPPVESYTVGVNLKF
ncbi:TonB-dependent receptor [Salinimicrobium sp. CDJ15-81-2]|nr:TonB-dependent receptor [Salinimicrobium nanhaiense]